MLCTTTCCDCDVVVPDDCALPDAIELLETATGGIDTGRPVVALVPSALCSGLMDYLEHVRECAVDVSPIQSSSLEELSIHMAECVNMAEVVNRICLALKKWADDVGGLASSHVMVAIARNADGTAAMRPSGRPVCRSEIRFAYWKQWPPLRERGPPYAGELRAPDIWGDVFWHDVSVDRLRVMRRGADLARYGHASTEIVAIGLPDIESYRPDPGHYVGNVTRRVSQPDPTPYDFHHPVAEPPYLLYWRTPLHPPEVHTMSSPSAFLQTAAGFQLDFSDVLDELRLLATD
ncbi:Uncharacterized protein PBTT_05538 [Plasmodiophora brassicae]|uniref:Uncharacterized protein n=2 Tax=Plasmodiophora brassicae TaxID=37360 RepID=A0A3P3YC00_PLABS|nr:unnamed protein product [Plasmodiophora brassicae]